MKDNKYNWLWTFTYISKIWGATKLEYITNKGKEEAFRSAQNNMRWDASHDLRLISKKKYGPAFMDNVGKSKTKKITLQEFFDLQFQNDN